MNDDHGSFRSAERGVLSSTSPITSQLFFFFHTMSTLSPIIRQIRSFTLHTHALRTKVVRVPAHCMRSSLNHESKREYHYDSSARSILRGHERQHRARRASRRLFSTTSTRSHGHLDPPKPGEEYVLPEYFNHSALDHWTTDIEVLQAEGDLHRQRR